MNPDDTDRLLELVAARHACLAQLVALGQRQLEMIEADDFATLLRVLSAKQHLLGDLHRLERELDPFRQQLPEARRWRDVRRRDRCAELIAQCRSLLGQIVGQEQDSERALVRRRDEAAQRLQGLHAAADTIGAYAAAAPGSLGGLDLSTQG